MRPCLTILCAAALCPALLLGFAGTGQPAAPEIKIGAVLPLTGAFVASGTYFKQGYTMAID